MVKIRKGVFETNSSSTHSCVISTDCKSWDTIIPDDDGSITINYGEYGWEYENYTGVRDKASYALTLTQYFNNEEEVLERLRNVIKEHTGAREVIFPVGDKEETYYDKGYVDHQSVDLGNEIFESDVSLKNFIFNPNSSFETDNDNR